MAREGNGRAKRKSETSVLRGNARNGVMMPNEQREWNIGEL